MASPMNQEIRWQLGLAKIEGPYPRQESPQTLRYEGILRAQGESKIEKTLQTLWEKELVAFAKSERRGRDSNPRYSCEHTGFRNQLDKPLRHLSEWSSSATKSAHFTDSTRILQAPLKRLCCFSVYTC